MVPKVLAHNPQMTSQALPPGLIPTSWDSSIFWMDESFSFGEAFQSDKPLGFSPFLLMEARCAFVLSLLDIQAATYFAGMTELSSLLFFLRSDGDFYSTTNFASSLREYTDKSLREKKAQNYSQMVLWESDVNQHLKFLAPHGRLLMASSTSMPEIPTGFDLVQKWNYGPDSEIGKLYLIELTR